ncbi:Uncharacterised protein [Clostridioides difficile]|uniref:hypothetical protein n=1 Tax=Clostridioides difficile TaxID=1496 RepID=UPI00102602A2|nr:hypothetical protein [Clostridioides difficile]UUV13104.1 hypothetical protein NQ183_10960 [Clostridioides difficile]VFC53602.1 Uncharacterised protein [Clostridioides difficile]VHX67663.1 Uncharacterised protein [Clostridioides difficile]
MESEEERIKSLVRESKEINCLQGKLNNEKKEKDVLRKELELYKLKSLCSPVIDFLRENYNSNYTLIINENIVKLVSDEISIPNMFDLNLVTNEVVKSLQKSLREGIEC